MKACLLLLLALLSVACSTAPPPLPSYDGAPRVPVNRPVSVTMP